MKIALLMSGQTRHFWYACESIFKNIIQPNDADVFCFLQKPDNGIPCEEYTRIISTEFGKSLKAVRYECCDPNYTSQFEELRNKYVNATKGYASALPGGTVIHYMNNGVVSVGIIDEWLKVKKCADLILDYEREKDVRYDAIMRIRIDIPWLHPFIFKDYDISSKNIYISYSDRSGNLWAKEYLFFGDRNTMLKTVNFVDAIGTDIHPAMMDSRTDCGLANEIQFGRFLQNNRIKYKSLKEYSCNKHFDVNWRDSKHFNSTINKDFTEALRCYIDSPVYDDRLNSNFVEIK